jgi:sialidase-1
LVAAVALTVIAAPPAGHAHAAGAPMFDEDVLFQGRTSGYFCFRIPTIVRANDGTLLAFAEGRVNNCADTGDIDLVLKRSTDGGQTWGPLQVVMKGNGETRGNPVPIVDRESGRVVLLSTQNPGNNWTPRRPFIQYSEDIGATWSAPKDMMDQVSRPEWAYWYATGPVHGIQLQRAPHAGRLVASVYFSQPGNSPRGGGLISSDDGGLNWHIGALDERVNNAPEPTCPNRVARSAARPPSSSSPTGGSTRRLGKATTCPVTAARRGAATAARRSTNRTRPSRSS